MRKGRNETYLNRCDNYSTQKEAFDLLFKYVDIEKNKKVWAPFYNEGLIKSYTFPFEMIHTTTDFFETNIDYDYIIDNPPYSCKEKVIRRCIELNKPFCLLLPIDTLERKYISSLFRDKDFTIIIPKKRWKFINNNSKVTMPFKSSWFTIGFKLNRQIIFE
jgi:hypothetical protein